MRLKDRLRYTLFWTIIAAAFVGPGTVTTAAKAGSEYALNLLWALFFSLLATMLLQETASRITLSKGKSLGRLFDEQKSSRWIKQFLFSSIFIGCAAYEAGNIVGAIKGLTLVSAIPEWIWILLIGMIAFLLINQKSPKIITTFLGLIVFVMGISFIWIALKCDSTFSSVAANLFILRMPSGSTLLISALIGTTIVPYNLFLASGLKHSQSLQEMRWGIISAVLIGGIISVSILFAGTMISAPFSFEKLILLFENQGGNHMGVVFAIGLFAAGMSSAITAPFAAAICGQSLWPQSEAWKSNGVYFRLTWRIILGFGLFLAILRIQPIPLIIVAQAINGILLPFIVAVLFRFANDRDLLAKQFRNSATGNFFMTIIMYVTLYLGLLNLISAFGRITSRSFENGVIQKFALLTAFIVLIILLVTFSRKYSKQN